MQGLRRLVPVLSLGLMLLLSGCYVGPGNYAATSVVVAEPNIAFRFSDGVGAYYAPAYATYVYGYNGYYYRWVGASWVYTATWGGYWRPLPASVFLPPLLVYGPPPPVVAYRPYFIWWRMRMAGWYQIHHPGWWYRHQMYLQHYAVWHAQVVRFYENHPYYRPRMHPLFRVHQERSEEQRREFYNRGPGYRQDNRGPGYRQDNRGPGYRQDNRGPGYRQDNRGRRNQRRKCRRDGEHNCGQN